MNKEEFIQDYIANRLSEEETARAETLLKSDAELQALYETHQELAAAFKISNDKALKQRLQALDSTSDEPELTSNVKKKNNFKIFSRLAIAAIFIVGAFIVFNQFTASEDLFDSYFEVCPNTYLPVTRGTTNQDVTFEAFKAYESTNYLQAEIAFKGLLANEDNLSIRFYYAMSLLNQEKFDLALNELNTLTTKTFDYQAESLWYAALIALEKGNSEAVKNQLGKLQELNPNYKSAEVQKILEKLP
ncbi:MAG: hypothetical protein AAF611_23045 [Bacteroidota bacterium]